MVLLKNFAWVEFKLLLFAFFIFLNKMEKSLNSCYVTIEIIRESVQVGILVEIAINHELIGLPI